MSTSCAGGSLNENILRWFGHLCQMNVDRLPRVMLNSKLEGLRPKGRPRVWWLDGSKLALSHRVPAYGVKGVKRETQSMEKIC